jgi:hypothetical protein
MSTTYTNLNPSEPGSSTTGRASDPIYRTLGAPSGTVPPAPTLREHIGVPGQASRVYGGISTPLGWETVTISRVVSAPQKSRVEYRDGAILLDPSQMHVDEPVVIQYRGRAAVAVKRSDGSVEFFRVP